MVDGVRPMTLAKLRAKYEAPILDNMIKTDDKHAEKIISNLIDSAKSTSKESIDNRLK